MDVDWVIHLGAISSTTERDLNKVMTQNNEFTNKLFNDCKRFGVNLQFASSASLYGSGKDFSESAQLDPVSPYSWSKYLSERHFERFAGGNTVHTFRYFNVYGDHEEHKGSQASPITQFRNQSKQNGIIRLFENSENYRRDFICVTDICRIHVEFIKKVKDSGVFNVGTGVARSFQEVADLINPNQSYITMPENLKRSYQEYTCSDNTKLESVLGPQKWITIEEFLDSSNK
jgi:ADP-L-glycero-D-manno-heptose 6-epimerase